MNVAKENATVVVDNVERVSFRNLQLLFCFLIMEDEVNILRVWILLIGHEFEREKEK